MQDMMEKFQTDQIMSSMLKVIMIDTRGEEEQGVDTGGVEPRCPWLLLAGIL